MKLAALVITAATLPFLASCTTAKIINGPDGTPHQLVKCMEIEKCYTKATEVCGGKYKIANTSTDVDGNSTTTNLLVKCQE